ncbi:hypothetical protein C1645_493116 [Glomus cerebriforme]|uniref:Uncharacterized protein n=1 Tax=Glomus cerebriforme TaxID=658196 RepID=A0A397SIU4_9GLOM|nr:hypothetical protein C1645_493116 [Glomus cerebriforme]
MSNNMDIDNPEELQRKIQELGHNIKYHDKINHIVNQKDKKIRLLKKTKNQNLKNLERNNRKNFLRLNNQINKLRRNNKALSDENKNLKRNNKALIDENENIKRDKEALNEYEKFKKDNKALIDENDNLKRDKEALNDECEKFERDNKALIDENDNLKRDKEALNNEYEKFKRMNQELSDRNEQLESLNNKLNNENGEWQNYVGKATTFSLNESDENHSVQFVKDIEELQRMLEKYVGNMRKVNLNSEEINKLLYNYECKVQVKVNPKENELQLVKAVLQRHVLEEIIEDANHHLSKTESLERNIYEMITRVFPQMLNEFSTKRDGANDITRALPIKIRQQIYGFLGSLGFADIINDKNKQEHPIISDIKDKLNKSINKLRTYKDPKTSKKHDDIASNLIRKVIRIFLFRLKVQEPVVDYYMISYDTKIDPKIMEGSWDNNEDMDEVNDLSVELCSFPLLIASDNEKDRKIYMRAKVVHQVEQEKKLE